MADEIEVQPQETTESGESPEQAAARKLDDATFEPQALVEQSGDYRQAEAIQENFVTLVDSAVGQAAAASDQASKGEATRQSDAAPSGDTASQAADSSDQAPKGEVQPPASVAGLDETIAGREPKVVEGVFEKGSGSGGGDNATITPINLPDVGVVGSKAPQDEAAVPQDDTLSGREPTVVEGVFEKSPGGDDDGGEDITPINLPNIRMGAQTEMTQTAPVSETRPAAVKAEREETVVGNAPAIVEGRVEKAPGGEDVQSAPVPQPVPVVADSAIRIPAAEKSGIDPIPDRSAGLVGEQAATFEPIGLKFTEGEIPVTLRQAGEGMAIKFDEGGQPAALRGQKVSGGENPPPPPPSDSGALAAQNRAQEFIPDQPLGSPHLDDVPKQPLGSPHINDVPSQPLGSPHINDVPKQPLGSPHINDVPKQPLGSPHLNDVPGQPLGSPHLDERGSQEAPDPGTKSSPPTDTKTSPGAGTSQTGEQSAPVSSDTGTETSSPPNTGEGTGTTTKTTAAAGTNPEAIDKEALGEAEEGWSPPEMYVTIDEDGNAVIVDANGEPIDSPPIVAAMTGDKGEPLYFGRYVGLESDKLFWIPFLERNFQSCTVGTNTEGELTVFDASGEPLSVQPKLLKMSGSNGSFYTVYNVDSQGNTKPFALYDYVGSLTGVTIGKDADGHLLAFDSTGEPLAAQPHITILPDSTAGEIYSVYYPSGVFGAQSKPVVLSAYSASLQGVTVAVGLDGNKIAVDQNGKPLSAQPIITTIEVDGVEQYMVRYSTDKPVTLTGYSGSLEGVSVYRDESGNLVAVDSSGTPLAAQPLITVYTDSSGETFFGVRYPTAEALASRPTTLQAYDAPLTDTYIALVDGKAVAVDADGKPLPAQPVIKALVGNDGKPVYTATYGSGKPVSLGYYLPQSGGSSTSQYLWK